MKYLESMPPRKPNQYLNQSSESSIGYLSILHQHMGFKHTTVIWVATAHHLGTSTSLVSPCARRAPVVCTCLYTKTALNQLKWIPKNHPKGPKEPPTKRIQKGFWALLLRLSPLYPSSPSGRARAPHPSIRERAGLGPIFWIHPQNPCWTQHSGLKNDESFECFQDETWQLYE